VALDFHSDKHSDHLINPLEKAANKKLPRRVLCSFLNGSVSDPKINFSECA